MQCIQMIPDEEGFLYPVVDTETCIHCGRCEQVCPVSAKREEKSFPQEAYVLQHRDEDVRHESTSGGAFSAIAEWIIGQGGVVFGAAFTDDFTVIHTAVVEKKDLWKFRNSKYVQSDVGRTYVCRRGGGSVTAGPPVRSKALRHIWGNRMRDSSPWISSATGFPPP